MKDEAEFLPETLDDQGCPTVELEKDGRIETRRVDELVALTFLGPRPSGYAIHHLDGDPRNCRVDNLAYVKIKGNR